MDDRVYRRNAPREPPCREDGPAQVELTIGAARVGRHGQFGDIERVHGEHVAVRRVALRGARSVIGVFAEIGAPLQSSRGQRCAAGGAGAHRQLVRGGRQIVDHPMPPTGRGAALVANRTASRRSSSCLGGRHAIRAGRGVAAGTAEGFRGIYFGYADRQLRVGTGQGEMRFWRRNDRWRDDCSGQHRGCAQHRGRAPPLRARGVSVRGRKVERSWL